MNDTAFAALCFWTGLNVLLMLALALNVTRHRFQALKEGYDERRLEMAIRAHGNNIEYVPVILFMFWLLAYQGSSAVIVHSLCGVLFGARLLHAHGIQQLGSLPRTRVIGNFATWGVMLVTACLLVLYGAADLL